jgi:hypothetical protein
MPRAHYIEDFAPESVQEFETLLANKNVSVIELPLPPNVSLVEFGEPGAVRDQSYIYLRDWLVQRSNLILGLWDGGMDRPNGGTADVLFSYLSEEDSAGEHEAIHSLGFNNSGPVPYSANVVAWVEVERSGSGVLSPSLSYLLPSLKKTEFIRTSEMPECLLQRLIGLKEHSDALLGVNTNNQDVNAYSLFEGLPEDPPASLRSSLKEIDDEFMQVDMLAIKDQESSGWLFKSFALLAATMGFLFLLYANLAPEVGVVIAYLGLFALAFVLFAKVGKKISFTRYLVRRVLAESLRVRFYMLLAGAHNHKNIQRLLSLSGIESISGFVCLNDVLKASQSMDASTLVPTPAVLFSVKHSWIDGQLSYFTSLVHRLSKKTKRLGQVKVGLMCLNLTILVMLIGFGDRLASIVFAETLSLKSFVVFILGLIPLWVGIWELYQSKMATRELLWQYKNQAEYFQRASKKLEGDLSVKAMQSIISDLGERSLFETYQWALHRYHRESEPSPTLFGTTGMAMFQGRVRAGRAKRARAIEVKK